MRIAVTVVLLFLLLAGMLPVISCIQPVESGFEADELPTSADVRLVEIRKEPSRGLGNLAPNPSFENGLTSPEGWAHHEYNGGAMFLWDDVVFHTGAFSVGIGNIFAPWTVYEWHTSQLIPVDPARNYVFSVWYMFSGSLESGQNAGIGIQEYDVHGLSLGTGFGVDLYSFNDSLWHYGELNCTHTRFNPSTAFVVLSLQYLHRGNASEAQVRFDDADFSVRTVTVPDDYATIQEAINAANEGDTVFVRNGTYFENVVVNKTVALLGEDKSGTIVDGYGGWWTVTITAPFTALSGFTITNGGQGIPGVPSGGVRLISNSSTVAGNLIVGNDYSGLWVGWGALETTYMQNTIERNLVAYNFYGIKLSYGASLNNLTNNLVMHNMHEGIGINDEENGNVLRQNTMVNNTYNINVYGGKHDIDTSNTVNGRPVYYLVGKQGFHVPQDAGYIGAVDCTNITVSGVLIRNVGKVLLVNVTGSIFENMDVSQTYAWGMYMLNSHNNTVRNVTLHHPSSHNLGLRDSCGNKIADSILANGNTGIDLYNSSRNIIVRNSIEGNYHGIFTTYSSNNRICHNNFLNNTHQIFIGLDSANNTWDNGCEGNYWSNYNGTDLGNDGVGDTYFPWEGVDNYPLMNPYWNAGDIDHDLDVDIFDAVRTAGAYDSIPSSPHWNPHCDIAEPYGIVNIFDIVLIASSYGEEYTP